MRLTDPSTLTPSIICRSRSVVTCAWAGRPRGAQPEFLHEHVRGGGEEHAQLFGPEATAARAPDLESVVEFLDPVFDVAAGAVHLFVDEARRRPKTRDDEPGIVPRVPAREPHHFGFDHHASGVRPRAGGIARLRG